jgi:ferrochelatase
MAFEALLLVSFGGPEGPDEVLPFLENVLRGRSVPRDRTEQVAAHYLEFGGVSPINGQNRALLAALQDAMSDRDVPLPVYWGNRNWHPFLADTVRTMATDGVRRAAAFVTSAYSSYSGCRQYLDDLARARSTVGSTAPEIVKLRPYFNHPGFVAPLAAGLRAARAQAGPDAPVLMTAHSIPVAMAATCDYERQLVETARLVAAAAGEAPGRWTLVFQSRSGPPDQPWLGPDVNDAIAAVATLPSPPGALIVVPIGFVSDHMEVVYDLDRVAAATATEHGMRLVRAATPGTDPAFVAMVVDLLEEADGRRDPSWLGEMGPAPFPCRSDCCPPPARAGPGPGPVDFPR